MSRSPRRARPLAASALLAALLGGCATASTTQGGARSGGELPRAHAPRPTGTAISAADLMTRLYILADDSMGGRASGTRGNVLATDYIAAEFRRAGLQPMGEGGTFFQTVPLVEVALDQGAALTVGGAALRLGTDFVPAPGTLGNVRVQPEFRGQNVQAVFGGRVGAETLPLEQARGKLVVLLPPVDAQGTVNWRAWRDPAFQPYPGAAALALVSLDETPAATARGWMSGQTRVAGPRPATANPAALVVSAAAAQRLLGAAPAGLRPGAAGATVSGAWRMAERPLPVPSRNVLAVIPGSDPALRGQYVAISAHNDHEPNLDVAIDHDSVKAYNRVMRPQGANDPVGRPTPEQAARIAAIRDSLRQLHGGVRMDSVMNGADDDGSGTVVLLEIAEELARSPNRPKRSILFISHTAEEMGLLGSQHFTDNPTVPRDSIVAVLNMDMVGRGRAEEIRGGGPRYIQLIGSRRLSTELGDLIDQLNAARGDQRMEIDYSFDAPGHPLNRYCRSDHYMYARYGIPITYMSHGYTTDYHQATDEPQYIDYPHTATTAGFVRDIAVALANRDRRIVVDKPRPDPNAPCRQ